MAIANASTIGPLNSAGEYLFDRKTLAGRWAVSVMTVKRREKDGTLKATYLPGGRLVRYSLAAVQAAESSKP